MLQRYALPALVFLLWVYVLLRAWFVPITSDEAISFFDFVRGFNILPPFAKWEANNHILNTLLTAVFNGLFGSHPFVLRLANTLSFPVFAWFLYKLFTRVDSRAVRWVGYLVILCAPGMLEFFSLSRGYGMSLALLAVSLTYFLEVFETGRKGAQVLWLLASIFMLLANLSTLPIVLLMSLLLTVQAVRHQNIRWIILVISYLSLGSFVVYGFILKEKGLLYFGTEKLWKFTVQYTSGMFYDNPLAAGLPLVFIALWLPLEILQIKSRKDRKSLHTSTVLGILFLGLVLFIVSQHLILGTPYPMGRSAYHILLILILGAVFSIDRWKFRWKGWLLAIGVLAPLNLVMALNLSNSQTWDYDRLPDGVFSQLRKFEQTHHRAPTLGTPFSSTSVWAFLQHASDRKYALLPYEPALMEAYDFLLLSADEPAPEGRSQVLSYPESPWVLYEKSPSITLLDRRSDTLKMAEQQEYLSLKKTKLVPIENNQETLYSVQVSGTQESMENVYFCQSVKGNREPKSYLQEDLSHYFGQEKEEYGTLSFSQVLGPSDTTSISIFLWNKARKNLASTEVVTIEALVN